MPIFPPIRWYSTNQPQLKRMPHREHITCKILQFTPHPCEYVYNQKAKHLIMKLMSTMYTVQIVTGLHCTEL